jgi:eukaryotic-like serine/threonine-protein kinase
LGLATTRDHSIGLGEQCPSDGQVAAYLHGQLLAERAEEIDAHLKSCSICVERLAHFRGIACQSTAFPTPEIHNEQLSETLSVSPADLTRSARLEMKRDARCDLVPGARIGNYVIQRELGRGAMGVAYLAENPTIGRQVAIKVISRSLCSSGEFATRFALEAQAITLIRHPNVVEVYDLGTTHSGQSYCVMEYLEGATLADEITSSQPLSLVQALSVIGPVCSGLVAAHRQGIVHRDLKPGNIFITGNPADRGRVSVKILDFGLAKFVDGSTDSLQLTRTGVFMGTPVYTAPEQAACLHGAIGPATDIYSIGVTLFQLLTGRLPFFAPEKSVVLRMHIETPPPRVEQFLPTLGPDIGDIVARCLAKDPATRPSAEELLNQLCAVSGEPNRWIEAHEDCQPASGRTDSPDPIQQALRQPATQPPSLTGEQLASQDPFTASSVHGEFLGGKENERRFSSWPWMAIVGAMLLVGLATAIANYRGVDAGSGMAFGMASGIAEEEEVEEAPQQRKFPVKRPTSLGDGDQAGRLGARNSDSLRKESPGKPKPRFSVVVSGGDSETLCQYRFNSGEYRVAESPCSIAAPRGATITLRVMRSGSGSLTGSWQVNSDRLMHVRINRSGRLSWRAKNESRRKRKRPAKLKRGGNQPRPPMPTVPAVPMKSSLGNGPIGD